MHKTAIRLADGRSLIYFDEQPGRARGAEDTRPLPPFSAASTLRRDPVLDTWVIVAGHRQERTHMPAASDCPLCPSADGRLSEIPAVDYEVVVFENRFPALSGDGNGDGDGSDGPGSGSGDEGVDDSPLFVERPGMGHCEVICFTPEHDSCFAALTPARVRLIVEAWTDRTRTLSAIPGVAQVFCFENRGPEIGVTEPHPHGQIYGYPFVTPRTQTMFTSATAYRRRTERNLFEDVVAAEQDGARVVTGSASWIAFVPFAARWPFEVHLYPRRRVADFTTLTDAEKDDLVPVYLDLLQRFDRLFGRPAPYIAAWHQAPVRAGRAGHDELALHLELFSSRRGPDKLKYLAGSESAMDSFVGDIVPEEAAARLRQLG